MPKPRFALGSFTTRELKIIELRTSGIRPREIAKRMDTTPEAIYAVIVRLYRKSGTTNTAQLTRWAVKNATDEALPAERPEDLPVEEPKVRRTKPRIKMRRI